MHSPPCPDLYIESVQRCFTRKLYGLSNLSYLDRLHVLGLETLEHRRLIHDLILCYKCLHGLIGTDNINFWCVQMSPRTRNNGLKLYKAHCNIDVRKAFFTNPVVDIWNSLPAAVVLVIMSLLLNAVQQNLISIYFCAIRSCFYCYGRPM